MEEIVENLDNAYLEDIGYRVYNEYNELMTGSYGHSETFECIAKNKESTPEEVKLTGGSSNYYKVNVEKPTSKCAPYTAECNDLIESLKMTFAEGEAFKAVWRRAIDRQGRGKPGSSAHYNAEKVVFFGERMVAEADY